MGEEIHVYVALLANLYCTHWNSFFLKTPSENCNEYITGTEQKRLLLRKALLLGDARDAVSVLLGNPPPSSSWEVSLLSGCRHLSSENCLLSAFSCQLGDGEGVGSQNLLLPLWFEIGHLNFIGDHLVGEVLADGPLNIWTCWYPHRNVTCNCFSRRSWGSTAWVAEWQWKCSDFFIAHLLVWRHPSGPPPHARDGRDVLWENVVSQN